jgi:murein DD-endopeptidase MepM/ murein hydrolase activator NlpD
MRHLSCRCAFLVWHRAAQFQCNFRHCKNNDFFLFNLTIFVILKPLVYLNMCLLSLSNSSVLCESRFMRTSAFTNRSRLFVQVAAVSLLAAFSAACSADVERFASNPFSNPFGSSPSDQAPTGSIGSQAGGSAPGGVVSSQALPPVGQSTNAYGQPPQQQAYGQGQYSAPPQQTQPQGSSWNTPVAGAPQQPYGQQPVAATGGAHTVGSGETIYSIARLYSVKPGDLAAANGMTIDTKVRVGQPINLPVGARRNNSAAATQQKLAQQVPSTLPGQAKPLATAALPAANLSAGTKQLVAPAAGGKAPVATTAEAPAATVTKAVARPETAPADSTSVEPARPAGELAFRWPVRGRIISGFGPKPNGVANEGVNLAVPEGTPVKAAESGVVVYAGNELKGYGNLVLVRHANGYVTAYANASSLEVKRGDQVRRGQVVAKSGSTGNVTAPQLHFEVRKGSSPVDPMLHLPNS